MFGAASMLCVRVRRQCWRLESSETSWQFCHMIKVWYGLIDALKAFILPQFEKLVLNEALAIDRIEEVVVRIVLLLAMDKCVMGDKEIPWCEFTGQFVPVTVFLQTLGAAQMKVNISEMCPANEGKLKQFRNWLCGWEGWQVEFTRFIQLRLAPNEKTLWYLLGRRAAGTFPCAEGRSTEPGLSS
ncbi:hypothetical protein F441_12487 [Phytophthora nicotianae CJ01A1]|uniref:Uncharacterized protein n=1 Tax=Phytophthora nicotianae CJ01A1 TaxID=1317063 RepID=W2WNH1_PHYNI|nr:hypothetical protein F441_12487 [Phytophthora nicotianae CJ01A1]